MTNKEIVQDLLRRIPDDTSLQDIARELEFIAAVRQGLSELDNGDSIPIEEVEKKASLMDYQVKFSPSAQSDIEDIVRYISIDDPDQALRFGRFLINHARGLAQFPERGRVVPEFDDDSIRELIVRISNCLSLELR